MKQKWFKGILPLVILAIGFGGMSAIKASGEKDVDKEPVDVRRADWRLRRTTQSDFLANNLFPSAISLPNNRSSSRNAGKVARSTAKATPGAGWFLCYGLGSTAPYGTRTPGAERQSRQEVQIVTGIKN